MKATVQKDSFPGEHAIAAAIEQDRAVDDYNVDIRISWDLTLYRYWVKRLVLRPDIYTSGHLAQYLAMRRDLVRSKVAVDMMTGSGILGVTMGKLGAESVVMSDITYSSFVCADENVRRYCLGSTCTVVRADLFAHEVYDGLQADVLVCNAPFAHGEPSPLDDLSLAFLGGTDLLPRFFSEARERVALGGNLIMPYRTEAGTHNDPSILGPQCGFEVQDEFVIRSAGGIAFGGPLRIYRMQKR